LATVTWPTTPLDPFFNANTMDDIAEAERLAALDGTETRFVIPAKQKREQGRPRRARLGNRSPDGAQRNPGIAMR